MNTESKWRYIHNPRQVEATGNVICKNCGHFRPRLLSDVLHFCPKCGKAMEPISVEENKHRG